jgi:hypothetical protein
MILNGECDMHWFSKYSVDVNLITIRSRHSGSMEGQRCYYTRSNILTTSPAPIRSCHIGSMEGKRCYYTRSNVFTTSPAPIRSRHSGSMEGKRCYYTRSNVLTTSPAPIRSRHSGSMEGKRCYYTRSNVLITVLVQLVLCYSLLWQRIDMLNVNDYRYIHHSDKVVTRLDQCCPRLQCQKLIYV